MKLVFLLSEGEELKRCVHYGKYGCANGSKPVDYWYTVYNEENSNDSRYTVDRYLMIMYTSGGVPQYEDVTPSV